MISIRRRLSLGLTLSLIGVGIGLLQGSLWLFESSLRQTLHAHLKEEAEGLLTALVTDRQGWQLDNSRVNPRYRRAFSGYYFRIQIGEQQWRSRSLWDTSPDWPLAPGLSPTLLDGPQDEALLAFRGLYRRGAQAISIDVAQDYSPVLDSLRQIRLNGLVLMAAALLILLVLVRWIMKTALEPLEQARQQIAQLQRGQRQQLDPEVPSELQPLVAQINHLLAHTDISLKRSRHALGNLGHALKTPLAVLSSLLQRDELAPHRGLRAQLRAQVQQIQQRVSLELNRARLASDVLPGRHFLCTDELPALFETLRMIHGTELNLHWKAPPHCQLARDREDLLELLGNLLDNACKWARHQVLLEIQIHPKGERLLIDDDGPGIAPEQRQQVRLRGQRLDERPEGHGLGLGIVDDIIQAWQGEWFLEDSPLGGLRVRIELPRPSLD